jgi:Ca2+-dependent lipid-binding protein
MRPPSRYGSVQLEFRYQDEIKLLNCMVIAGKDLLACDLNGLSDPYVTVELRNLSSAEKRGFAKSPVKFKTLAPTFMYEVSFDLRGFVDLSRWRLQLEIW